MRRHAVILALTLSLPLPASLAAQSQASADPRDGVMLAFETFASLFGSRLVAAFDSIPGARYDYRPTPAQQSIGYIAAHLEDANYDLCARFADLKRTVTAKDSLADSIKARWPKDTLVARLRASLQFCDSALVRVGTLDSGDRARTLLAFETDLAEHYAQLAVYMRLLGMVPPSALAPRTRTAIELPASTLSPCVGVYELARGLDLTITIRENRLFIASTNGATVRLWPETSNDFFINENNAQITFIRDAGGAVTGLVVHQFGRDRHARRVK